MLQRQKNKNENSRGAARTGFPPYQGRRNIIRSRARLRYSVRSLRSAKSRRNFRRQSYLQKTDKIHLCRSRRRRHGHRPHGVGVQ